MLELNGIQHFIFCKRQWALISVEAEWAENADTMLGRFIHERVDDPYYEEKRKGKIIVRAMPIISRKLGFIGRCDVVEFIKSESGVPVRNYGGLWKINVIEYKKGKPKSNNSLNGGHQERGRRAGTENVAAIAALGRACELAAQNMPEETRKVRALRDRLENGLLARVPKALLNGHKTRRLPGTCNISFEYVEGEAKIGRAHV